MPPVQNAISEMQPLKHCCYKSCHLSKRTHLQPHLHFLPVPVGQHFFWELQLAMNLNEQSESLLHSFHWLSWTFSIVAVSESTAVFVWSKACPCEEHVGAKDGALLSLAGTNSQQRTTMRTVNISCLEIMASQGRKRKCKTKRCHKASQSYWDPNKKQKRRCSCDVFTSTAN